MADEPVKLDYATPGLRPRGASFLSMPRPASPKPLPTAYPPDEPVSLPLLMICYLIIPLTITCGLLAFLYLALLRPHAA